MSNPADVVAAGLRKDPTEFLKSIIHKPVVVKLNSGVDYRGAQGVPRVPGAPRRPDRAPPWAHAGGVAASAARARGSQR